MPSEAAANTQQVTSHQLIEQSLEEMIADMNAKRSRDQTLLQSGYHDVILFVLTYVFFFQISGRS